MPLHDAVTTVLLPYIEREGLSGDSLLFPKLPRGSKGKAKPSVYASRELGDFIRNKLGKENQSYKDPDLQPNHSYRRYVLSTLKRNEVDEVDRKRIGGHGEGISDLYQDKDIAALARAMPVSIHMKGLTMDDRVTSDTEIKATGKEIRALWRQIKKNETWVSWLELGEKIVQGHDRLMSLLGYNDQKNPSFLKRWGEWLAEQDLNEIDKGVRSRLSFCVEHKDEIAKWQQEIGVSKALLYNHPNSVYRNFMKSRGNGTPTPRERKTDRVEVVKRERDEALMEVARLADEVEAQTKRAEAATASAGFMWDATPEKVAEKMLQANPEKAEALATALGNDLIHDLQLGLQAAQETVLEKDKEISRLRIMEERMEELLAADPINVMHMVSAWREEAGIKVKPLGRMRRTKRATSKPDHGRLPEALGLVKPNHGRVDQLQGASEDVEIKS